MFNATTRSGQYSLTISLDTDLGIFWLDIYPLGLKTVGSKAIDPNISGKRYLVGRLTDSVDHLGRSQYKIIHKNIPNITNLDQVKSLISRLCSRSDLNEVIHNFKPVYSYVLLEDGRIIVGSSATKIIERGIYEYESSKVIQYWYCHTDMVNHRTKLKHRNKPVVTHKTTEASKVKPRKISFERR